MPKAPLTLLDKVIVDKALDRANRLRQQYLRNGMSAEKLQSLESELIDNLDPIVEKWKPSMMRGPRGMRSILNSGKFKNQFETSMSSGAFDPEERRKLSNEYFLDSVDDIDREKYGFLKRPKKYGIDDVNWYGDYEITFKPQVRKRMTLTNGDSLNEFDKGGYNWRSPSPIVPSIKETYINWTGQPAERVFAKFPSENRFELMLDDLKERPGPFRGFYEGTVNEPSLDDYVEAQYHGPLMLEDVEGIGIPNSHLEENPNQDLFRMRSDQYEFPIYDWSGKCIYNCR